MKVGILAGGVGSRLTEETDIRPKPMVEIGGKPILWHIMRHYLRHGFSHFVLALGYKGEHIKRYMVDYRTYNDSNLSIDMHNGDVKTVSTTTPLSESWTVDLIETGTKAETGTRIKRIVPVPGRRHVHVDLRRRGVRRRSVQARRVPPVGMGSLPP